MISRSNHITQIHGRFNTASVVAILGARQVGKTTLARELARNWEGPVNWFDLEDPTDLTRLTDPKLTLAPLDGLVVLDEIQRLPEVFPILRVLVDRPDSAVRFLILGSASPDLLRQSSESLAGRISYYELPGFDLVETGSGVADKLWVRGGFPLSFLAGDDESSERWRRDFIRTYLERDLPQLGFRIPPGTLHRFWTMLAHSHGQIRNASRLAGSLGVAHTTVRSYLDMLSDTFMARQLQPYLSNIGKRQVKSPKMYLRDSGLVHTLLGIADLDGLLGHPVVGASWEGFAMEQIIRRLEAEPRECYFWATHNGAELDLLVEQRNRRLGFEFKRTSAPRTTRSMHSALESLDLDSLTIVYPGDKEFRLSKKITARPLTGLWET